jgi:hypothetical protein
MYEISSGVRSTRNQDGGTVLDVSQGKIFHLNGIGALIFERLRQKENTLQIIAEISRAYGISSEVVETDVIQFLDRLEQQGLVQYSEKVAPSCTT